QPNPVVRDGTIMRGMRVLQRVGLVGEVGVSNYSLDRWRAAEQALGARVLSNQVRYSLVDRSPERDLLPFAESTGRLVIAYSPTGRSPTSPGRRGWSTCSARPARRRTSPARRSRRAPPPCGCSWVSPRPRPGPSPRTPACSTWKTAAWSSSSAASTSKPPPARCGAPSASRTAWTDSGMQGGLVDELLGVAVECPALDQLEVEVGRTPEDRVQPGLAGDHGEERHLDAVDQAGGHQRPVHRQAAVRAQRHLGLLLEPGDDVDGVAAHEGRVRPVEGSFQCARYHRGRQVPHPGDPRVTHAGLLGARGQHPRERPIRVGPEDHPLLLVVQGEAVVEELGALLAPVAAPVAAGGAEAVEAGKDVEGVGTGHGALLE